MARNKDGVHGIDAERAAVSLPPRPFLYTLDQIATLTDTPLPRLRDQYIYFEGITIGRVRGNEMLAYNLNADNEFEKPDWRVSEVEFIGWLQYMGFKISVRASTFHRKRLTRDRGSDRR